MDTKEFFTKLSEENLSDLERKTDLSRRALGSAKKTHNMKLDNLEVLAEAMGYTLQFVPDPSEENVLSSLKRFGAPLAHEAGGTLSLEDALVEGAKLARKEGLYESVVPYVLATQAKNLDALNLLAKAHQKTNLTKVMGYFAEMANAFAPHPLLQQVTVLAKTFTLDQAPRETLVEKEKVNFPELFEKNQTALRWGLMTRGTEKDHFERWTKWLQLHKQT